MGFLNIIRRMHLRQKLSIREMVDVLAIVLHHEEQAVLTAAELSLAEGVPTKTHVLNLLHRLVGGKVVGGPLPPLPVVDPGMDGDGDADRRQGDAHPAQGVEVGQQWLDGGLGFRQDVLRHFDTGGS